MANKKYDFRLIEDKENILIWYSINMDISVWQILDEGILCGWKGILEDMPEMEEMVITRNLDEIVEELSDDVLKQINNF